MKDSTIQHFEQNHASSWVNSLQKRNYFKNCTKLHSPGELVSTELQEKYERDLESNLDKLTESEKARKDRHQKIK